MMMDVIFESGFLSAENKVLQLILHLVKVKVKLVN